MILLDRPETKPVRGEPFLMLSAEGFTLGRLLLVGSRWLVWRINESGPERMLDPSDRLIGQVTWSGNEDPLRPDSETGTHIPESAL